MRTEAARRSCSGAAARSPAGALADAGRQSWRRYSWPSWDTGAASSRPEAWGADRSCQNGSTSGSWVATTLPDFLYTTEHHAELSADTPDPLAAWRLRGAQPPLTAR